MERGSLDLRNVAEGMDLGYDHQGGGRVDGQSIKKPQYCVSCSVRPLNHSWALWSH